MNRPTIKYDPNIFEIYFLVFFRKGLLAGNKSPISIFHDHDAWLLHARYLLSKTEESHIDRLFELRPISQWWDVPIFLSCLLKIRGQAIQALGEEIIAASASKNDLGNSFYRFVWRCTMLLLLEEDIPTEYYKEALKNEPPNEERRAVLTYCLGLAEGTMEYAKDDKAIRIHRYITSFLQKSRVLRAGIQFKKPLELQRKLGFLLEKTTALHQLNLLQMPRIPVMSHLDWEYRMENQLVKKVQAKEFYEKEGRLNKLQKDFKVSSYKQYFPKQKRTAIFEAEVFRFLYENGQKNEPILYQTLVRTDDYQDILAGLELDLRYQLSVDIVRLCYDKLLTLIPRSIPLLKQYAVDLLLRSSTYDDKAKALYAEAEALSEQYFVEEYCDIVSGIYGPIYSGYQIMMKTID